VPYETKSSRPQAHVLGQAEPAVPSAHGRASADAEALQPPRAEASAESLSSPRFRAVEEFARVLAGQLFMRWGSCPGAPTFALQGALGDLDHDVGPIDGIWGPKTQAALMAFQRDAGVLVDGVLGPQTLGALDHADKGAGTGSGVGKGGKVNPALKHQVKKNSKGEFVDPESPQPHTTLPYITTEAWRGEAILRRWTQVDRVEQTETDGDRCAANAMMASRIMMGPQAVLRLADRVSRDFGGMLASSVSDPAYRDKLLGISDGLALGVAALQLGAGTYESLHYLSDAIKVMYTVNAKGGTAGFEAQVMNGLEAEVADRGGHVPTNMNGVDHWCNQLAPGESWLVQVDTDVSPPGQSAKSGHADHFVTIGCKPGKTPEEGGVYLYDPWPRKGSQTIMRDTQRNEFIEYFIDHHGGIKYTEFLSRSMAKGTRW